MSRTRRTPQQMIEEQEARLDKLKEKAALDAAKQSPELVQIVEAIQQETKAIQEAQRGLGKGPQSFDARIESTMRGSVSLRQLIPSPRCPPLAQRAQGLPFGCLVLPVRKARRRF
jgi:hypothetical protein